MDIKSRYEVIAELENKKRDLIREKNGLNDNLIKKEKELKEAERNKSDSIIMLDRRLDDMKDDIKIFKETMNERKETIIELVKSMDESLARFGKLNQKSDKSE